MPDARAISSLKVIKRRGRYSAHKSASTPALVHSITVMSSVPTSIMLPNRKLNKSMLKPPLILISIMPTESPVTNVIATATSPGIFALVRSFWSPILPITDTPSAIHVGYAPISIPAAIPPNATWAMPSPNRASRRMTKNAPVNEQMADMAMPEISARCINPYSSISSTMRYTP